MLPPCRPGGTEWGRSAPGTATPMIPRNGRSGKRSVRSAPARGAMVPTGPFGVCSTPAKTLTVPGPAGYSPGRAPRPWRLETTP